MLPPQSSAAFLRRLRPLARAVGLKSLACCGMKSLPVGVGVPQIVRSGGKGYLNGVQRCASPWACPVCSPAITGRRVEALRPQILDLLSAGWSAHLVTLTLRHHVGQTLDELFDFLGRAWRRLASGRTWQEWKSEGLEYVRGYDLTHGGSGWHPHLHLVLLLPPGCPGDRPQAFLSRWCEALRGVGGSAVIEAQHVEECADASRATRYAVSLSGVWETVGAPNKTAKANDSRTAFELARAAVCGDSRAASLWQEYALATKGKRPCTVSRGLKLVTEEDAAANPDKAHAESREVVAIIDPCALRALDVHLCDVLRACAISADEGRRALIRAIGPPGRNSWRESKPPDH